MVVGVGGAGGGVAFGIVYMELTRGVESSDVVLVIGVPDVGTKGNKGAAGPPPVAESYTRLNMRVKRVNPCD